MEKIEVMLTKAKETKGGQWNGSIRRYWSRPCSGPGARGARS